MQLRVGHGFDAHVFSDDPQRRLVLGGVEIGGGRGLEGHSDADVVAHACCDALLGAAGLGDLGARFGDADPRWEGASSLVLLAEVASAVRGQGWTVTNVDCTVVCERPRIAPRREEMQRRLGDVLGAPVSVKAASPEGMGALGRGEGVSCTAVALLVRGSVQEAS